MTKTAGDNQGRTAGGAASGGLMTVALRNEFYRDGFNKALMVAVVTSIWAVLATAFGIGVLMYKPKPQVIASTPTGQIFTVPTIDRPMMDRLKLAEWAKDCALKAYDLDFERYRKQLTGLRQCMSVNGFNSLMDSHNMKDNLARVKLSRLMVTSTSTDAPIFTREGIDHGAYTLTMQLPMRAKFQSTSEQKSQSLLATLVVKRVDLSENISGYVVDQMNFDVTG